MRMLKGQIKQPPLNEVGGRGCAETVLSLKERGRDRWTVARTQNLKPRALSLIMSCRGGATGYPLRTPGGVPPASF
jgi:hypothetical protein